ncbi:uncharacterized protein BDZ99DRAFT_487586 [Mytilinidion resinicola]|uniref:Peptidase M43 pregnancy-associated plasma-A domain-containing protein n=1 Tax=Mytilinidion resinicola TaxID=574789 RepID=A0A6A6YS02_9PEZI|nr:uncharacterized protein BDZ99DRAFT_487586 [Mytilinidion resinicola]KAF2810745.1 hypothetical protein BDZ99DRAFT_487586 [Mytilinidion resinicola]
MLFQPLLLASLALAAAATNYKHFDCGTNVDAATKEFMSTLNDLHTADKAGSRAARAALLARDGANAAIKVDAVFHIIATAAKKDDITPDMPSKQLDALNTAYAPYQVAFNLLNITWTVNDTWAVGTAGADDRAMKPALRQGSYRTLNLYFQTDLAGSVLGKCTLPSSIGPGTPSPAVYANDGCNGGGGYDQGMTAVHETGHWLGLLHVFEGYSCAGSGDFIDDTPMQSTSTDGCPTGGPAKDSCPGSPGVDAVHDIMDYSTDACYTGFKDGQVARMRSMWGMYRSGK